MTTYNGWKNYETWNVTLWIDNEQTLNQLAVRFMSTQQWGDVYLKFLEFANLTEETKDGVKWSDTTLDYPRLNEWMRCYEQ